MNEGRLTIVSISSFSLSIATTVQILQIAALLISIIAGCLAISKHFKK